MKRKEAKKEPVKAEDPAGEETKVVAKQPEDGLIDEMDIPDVDWE